MRRGVHDAETHLASNPGLPYSPPLGRPAHVRGFEREAVVCQTCVMDPRQLLFAQFTILGITALLYFAGFVLYLQWVFWWYDIVLHFLGGAWVVLALLWMLSLRGVQVSWATCIAVTIAVGIAWECFEFLIGAPRERNYLFDTSLDLLMDVIGGVVAVIIVFRNGNSPNSVAHSEEERVTINT